jgi:outer membrane receptor protein involved in Fe transport
MTLRIVRAAAMAGASLVFVSSAALAEIEIVTVTAEKRSENIQTVPIAITAVSATQLKAAQIRDFNDLQQVAPSLLVSTGSGDTTGGLVRIRGVGTTGNNAGLEASVGVFVDGVYRSRSAAVLEDLLAVDRVEVLRGPQGTLFGKNTTAGAISIISVKPTQDFYADVTASVGTLGAYRVIGDVNVGVTDTLALNLAGVYSVRDGFLIDVNDGHKSNGRNHFGLKGQALWNPTSNLEVRVIADYTQKADSSSDAAYALYSTRTRELQDVVQSAASPNFGKVFPTLVTLPQTGPDTQPVNFEAYRIATNFPRVSDVNDGGVSVQIDWTINDAMSLTSISAYRDFKSLDSTDTDYSPADFIRAQGGRGELRNITQELQLKGTAGSIDWLLGAFYSDETVKQLTPGTFGADASLVWAHIAFAGTPVGTDAGIGTLGCILGNVNTSPVCIANGLGGVHAPIFGVGDGVAWHFATRGNSLSFFTHDTWRISDQLSTTIGVRYNHENKHGTFDGGVVTWHSAAAQIVACGTTDPFAVSNALVGAFAIFCHRTPYDQKTSEDSVTGTANVSWHPTDRLMFYGSYSRGYKAGPFNLDPSWNNPVPVAPAVANSPHAKPEYDDNFEVGARSTLLDGRAIVNLTLFHEKFMNFQINTFNGLTFSVANFKHVYADGFELETTLEPTEGLTLNNSVTYADSRYGHDVATIGFPTGAPTILAGARLTQAPLWTLNTGLNYSTPLGVWDSLGFVSLSANYRSSYNTGSDLNPFKRQGSFVTVNGQIGVKSDNDRWEFALYGRNIFNKHYNVVAFNTPAEQATGAPSVSSAISVFPGDPATYGLSLTLHE